LFNQALNIFFCFYLTFYALVPFDQHSLVVPGLRVHKLDHQAELPLNFIFIVSILKIEPEIGLLLVDESRIVQVHIAYTL
jgi:hypothetical protein